MHDIIESGSRDAIESFTEKVSGKRPLFICTLGNTETAKIPGISAAGANPAFTDYTPAADAEYLYYGYCKCIEGVPVTPDGIPTPGLITKVALDLSNIPFLIAVGGLRVLPQTPYVDFGGMPGNNIATGHAIDNAWEPFARAKAFGEQIAKTVDYLIIGESIAGGTTTALGVLTALGIDAAGKISSSLPVNPTDLKVETVTQGLDANNLQPGDLSGHPFAAIETVGDPMQAVFAGLVAGAAATVPVVLAGGTQMTAILACIKEIQPAILENVAIGTTRWIITDASTDLRGIVDQIDERLPIFASNLNFSQMSSAGLLAYEQGVVKEGVGAGGATIGSLWANPDLSIGELCRQLEITYNNLIKNQLKGMN